jgi:hypothetical protein
VLRGSPGHDAPRLQGTVETSAGGASHKEKILIERDRELTSRFVADAASIVPMASAMTAHRACRN